MQRYIKLLFLSVFFQLLMGCANSGSGSQTVSYSGGSQNAQTVAAQTISPATH